MPLQDAERRNERCVAAITLSVKRLVLEILQGKRVLHSRRTRICLFLENERSVRTLPGCCMSMQLVHGCRRDGCSSEFTGLRPRGAGIAASPTTAGIRAAGQEQPGRSFRPPRESAPPTAAATASGVRPGNRQELLAVSLMPVESTIL